MYNSLRVSAKVVTHASYSRKTLDCVRPNSLAPETLTTANDNKNLMSFVPRWVYQLEYSRPPYFTAARMRVHSVATSGLQTCLAHHATWPVDFDWYCRWFASPVSFSTFVLPPDLQICLDHISNSTLSRSTSWDGPGSYSLFGLYTH